MLPERDTPLSLQALLTQTSDELAQKRAALKSHADAASTLPADKVWDHVKAMEPMERELADLNDKVSDLQVRVESAKRNEDAIKANREPATIRQTSSQASDPDADPDELPVKSLRTVLRESDYGKALKAGTAGSFKGSLGTVAYKTVISTANGNIGQAQRLPMTAYPVEERTTADLMLQGTTSAPSLEYYEETTFTNSAAEATESTGAKAESALAFTLRTEAVRTIATWIPVTTQMMEDGDAFESYLRERLGFMVRRREETQILTGDGNAPNLRGILNRSGIQTQAKGADPTPDAVYKAMTLVRSTGFAEPTAAVFHPNDWQDIRLLRTVDGIYIWGSPADAGQERIWGLEVRVTTAETEGTGLVGAFRPYAQLFRRTGIELAVSDSHDTYFIYNKLAVRAEERISLACYRPSAFCKVTGI